MTSRGRSRGRAAASLTVLIAALLTTTWPNGHVQLTPALDNEGCELAARLDLSRNARSATCTFNLTPAEAGFKPGWDCIKGLNCK